MTDTSPEQPSRKISDGIRIPELDGLRGVAVLLVMAYHAFAYEMIYEQWQGLAKFCVSLTNLGWLGVDLFFVLSGFLITGVLLRTRHSTHQLRDFYWRRGLRILPLYFVVLLVVWLCYQGAGSFVLLSALFLANLAPMFQVPLVYGPLWSLAVEEHFYFIWPLVSRAISARSLGLLAGCIAVTQPMIRAFGFLNQTEVYYYTWFRLDGLAWGACLASFLYLASDEQKVLRRFVLLGWLSGIVVMVLGIPFGILTRQRLIGASLLFSAAQLFFLGLLAATLAWRDSMWTSLLRWRWLRRCGEWSYCLYLIHLMFLQGVGWLIVKNGWLVKASSGSFGFYVVRAAVAFVLAFIVAKLSFRYFESPMLRRKLSDVK